MAKIELNDKQLRLVQDALELYSRVGILQLDHILYHPTIDTMITERFRPKKELEMGDETDRGTIVEIGDGYIKTKSRWCDWEDRIDASTVEKDSWPEEVRNWDDVENIKQATDWNQVHQTKDKIKSLCNELKNVIADDSMISSQYASYGIGRGMEGQHNIDAYDMIQVIRNEFWKKNPNRNFMTVDSSICKFGTEPLIKVNLEE